MNTSKIFFSEIFSINNEWMFRRMTICEICFFFRLTLIHLTQHSFFHSIRFYLSLPMYWCDSIIQRVVLLQRKKKKILVTKKIERKSYLHCVVREKTVSCVTSSFTILSSSPQWLYRQAKLEKTLVLYNYNLYHFGHSNHLKRRWI